MTSQPAEPELVAALERGLRAPRAAGVAGLAFAVLFIVSIVLLRRHPAARSSSAAVFMLGVSTLALRTSRVPRWLALRRCSSPPGWRR
jgi:hypothetical protein